MKNEKRLTAALKRGDERAFEKLYLNYSPKLYFFSFKYLKCQQEAEEIVQSIFLKIWENRENINPELSFNAYLIQIGKSIIWKYYKKQELASKYNESLKDQVHLYSNNTEDYIIFSEMEQMTKKHINSMPEKRKQVFMLSRIEGMNHAEIAQKLNISVGTVKQHMNKALKSLSKELESNGLLHLFIVFHLIS